MLIVILGGLGFVCVGLGAFYWQARQQAQALRAELQLKNDLAHQMALEQTQLQTSLTHEKHSREALKAELSSLEARYEEVLKLSSVQGEQLRGFGTLKETLEKEGKAAFLELARNAYKEERKTWDEKHEFQLHSFKEELKRVLEGTQKLEGFEKLFSQNLESMQKGIGQLRGFEQLLLRNSQGKGEWGEMQLERLLNLSGLREGTDYKLQPQFTLTNEDGSSKRVRPDVVLYLPDGTSIAIDAKMSVQAYQKYLESRDPKDLSAFKTAVKERVIELSHRDYKEIQGVFSQVFMFVPLESAYLMLSEEAGELLEEASRMGVFIVGRSAFYPIVRLIVDFNNQHKREESFQKLIEHVGRLFDKLTLESTRFIKLGEAIEKLQVAYEESRQGLFSGKGNLKNTTEALMRSGFTGQTGGKSAKDRIDFLKQSGWSLEAHPSDGLFGEEDLRLPPLEEEGPEARRD